MPSLSISSSMKTGLFVPALLDALDDPAGQRADVGAAVAADLRLVADRRRGDMRTNLRPSARAIDLPSEVLPTPGGPTKQRIGLRIAVG